MSHINDHDGTNNDSNTLGFLFSFIGVSGVSGLWTLVSGLWSLVSGLWSLVSGLWSLVSGLWSLVSGLWSLVSGLWFLTFLISGASGSLNFSGF
jgi:hypothetical protein